MFEIVRLKNGYCQLLNELTNEDADKIVKDSKVTHLSTWLITSNPELAGQLRPLIGEKI